jgi:hypothetical protein
VGVVGGGGAGAALGPLPAILQGIQQQNAAVQQHQVDVRAEEQRLREKKEWLTIEGRKVPECEGLPEPAMRKWPRVVMGAMGRIPQLQNAGMGAVQLQALQVVIDLEFGRALIARSAGGNLIREIDRHWLANPNDDVPAIVAEMELIFLGADEMATKRSELKDLRQKGGPRTENGLPAFCRDFADAADAAYPIAGRNVEIELKLAE